MKTRRIVFLLAIVCFFGLNILAHDITPKDIDANGECARYIRSEYKCTVDDEGKTKTSKEVTGIRQWNSETYYYCKSGIWYRDRKKSYAVNDSGSSYEDRCKYIKKFK